MIIDNPDFPNVLLDVDGVLANFILGFCGVVQKLTGHEIREHQITEWDVMRALPPHLQKDAALIQRLWAAQVAPGHCRGLVPYPGAKEGVQALQRVSNLYFCTSPMEKGPTWAHERIEWLKHEMGVKDAYHRTISTHAKHRVHGDFFIDDHEGNCLRWQKNHPGGKAYLWDSQANRSVKGGVPRVGGWGPLVDVVCAYRPASYQRNSAE